MRTVKKSLSLEVLEARALFAGAQAMDMASIADQIDLALQSPERGKISATFDQDLLGKGTVRLVLTGTDETDLTINFDKLPGIVSSIVISHFDSVKFEGADGLFNLIASDVRALEAPAIDVFGYFVADNVDKISLKSVSGFLQISGDKVEAKIDDLSGPGAQGTPIHLRTLNALTLETTSPKLNFESIWNGHGLVIALPNVPSTWDAANPASWKVSGVDNLQGQVRLGTRDISITAPVEEPAVEVPSEGAEAEPDAPQNPTLPTLVSDIDLRSFLDRLEVLFNQSGGFSATGFDATTVKRVVAQLSQTQETSTTAPSAIDILPLGFVRRDISTPLVSEQLGTNLFSPVVDAKTPVVIMPSLLEGDIAAGLSSLTVNVEGSAVSFALTDSPLRTPEYGADGVQGVVHVTVDPEAPVDAPKTSLQSIISLLMDRAVDLKQYVLDQLSQEVVPGERTGVLLVDPKPIRQAPQPKLLG